MFSPSHPRAWHRHAALLLVISGFTSCSGGGGGGGPDPIVYTGATTQAVITSLNAAMLAGGAYLTGTSGASANVFGAQAAATPNPRGPRSLLAAKALKKSVARLTLSASPAMAAGAIIEYSDTITGTCAGKAGSLGYVLSIDDITGDLEGTLNYNDLCLDDDPFSPEDDITMSGRVNIQGNIDPILFQLLIIAFNQMTLDMSVLNISTTNDTFGIAGVLDIIVTAPGSEQFTQSMRFKGPDGTVIKNEGFVMQVVYDSPFGFDTISIVSGKYFWPPEGYVDVAGTADFEVALSSLFPRTGELEITGANDSRAELSANDDAETFSMDVYEDGVTLLEIDGNRWDEL